MISVGADIRFKHGILFEFMRDNGMSQADLARRVGIAQSDIGRIVNMISIPSLKVQTKLSEITGYDIDTLFPEAYCLHVKTRKRGKAYRLFIKQEVAIEKFAAMEEMKQLSAPSAERLLEYEALRDTIKAVLKPREQEVLRRRFFDGETLDEIAEAVGATRERCRQIEKRALEKLRYHISRTEEEQCGEYIHEPWRNKNNPTYAEPATVEPVVNDVVYERPEESPSHPFWRPALISANYYKLLDEEERRKNSEARESGNG